MMGIQIRYVRPEDKAFWYSLDRHLPEAEFDRKVRDRKGYVLLAEGKPVGLLRYNLFWDNTPFCTMLFVDWNCQGKGYGRRLMEYWEADIMQILPLTVLRAQSKIALSPEK